MAHKKAAGSAKNLRDSNPKYRGVKLFGWEFAHAGNIIIRQKGDKYQLGRGVYKGKDFTIHASIDGIVSFTKKKIMRYDGRKYLKTVVEVLPVEEKLEIENQKSEKKQTIPKKDAPTKKEAVKEEASKETLEKKVLTKKIKTKESVKKTPPKKSTGDDLTKIEGIGPKIQEVLYVAGVLTYADLSGSKIGDLRQILADNKLPQHDPATWKKQATLAKNGKWEDLKALQDELNGGK